MSVPFFLCLIGCIGAGVEAVRQHRLDEYHLMHGPKDGCVECEDK